MKKIYFITFLAIATVICLQGYNINLQYQNYALRQLEIVNDNLMKAVDEELHYRTKSKKNSDRNGEHHIHYKIHPDESKRPLIPKGDDTLSLKELDLAKLKEMGIVNSMGDALILMMQDIAEEKGNHINLKNLDAILSRRVGFAGEHTLLLKENGKVISAEGTTMVPSSWKYSQEVAISIKHPKYIQVALRIPPSSFIMQSVYTLILSVFFVLLAIVCIGFQLRELNTKDRLITNREVGVNGIIHDLKSPINSLVSVLSLLKMKLKDNDELVNLLTLASEKTKLLVCDIESILVAARGNNDKLLLNLGKVDIIKLAEQTISDVNILFRNKPHTISITDETNGKSMLMGDEMYLRNVLRNLLENSLNYSDAGVSICVSIRNVGNSMIISVKDNGWGISSKEQKLIFKQFYRGRHKNGPRGFGIGLAIVKYVVEAHKGSVYVESSIDKGSEFVITLPVENQY